MGWLLDTIGPPWVLMALRCSIFALCLARAAQAGTAGGRVALVFLGAFSLLGVLSGAEAKAPQTTVLTLGLNLPLAYTLFINWLRGPRGPHQEKR